MSVFFLLIELFIPLFALYLILQKGELSIVYLPFLAFCSDVVIRNFPAFFTYLLFSALVLYYIYYNPAFPRRNLFAIILLIYFLLLLPYSKDLVTLRMYFIPALWIFLLIPIVAEVFGKYPRKLIFDELSKSSLMILSLFIINSLLATYYNFSPYELYGFSSGFLNGALSLDDLNILPFAGFIVFRKGIKSKNFTYISIYLVATFLILLTFRRSVMFLWVLGTVVTMIDLMNTKQIGDLVIYCVIIISVSFLVISQTGFLDVFWERYAARRLDNRPLEQEGRMMELGLLYRDLFVYYDYSPWFGYELFASSGNYGKSLFGNRSLHTDFASIVHSSGLIGLFLYLSMVIVAFTSVWRRIFTRADYLQFFFICIAFLVFAMSGRWHTVSSTTMMYCLLYLPLCRESWKGQRAILNERSKEFRTREYF